jgi:hypothetical protein
MLNLNQETLQAVADKALLDAAAHPRWVVAIGRALLELEQNPWIERGDHGLIIGSTSGKCYAANGTCQCTAFEFKTPCWHRAAARLVRLHDEALHRDLVADERTDETDYEAMRQFSGALNMSDMESDHQRPLGQRQAAARAATAAINELF